VARSRSRGLLRSIHASGVHHILPASQRTAEQPVALLHLIPTMHFELAAGHAQARAGAEPLGFQKCLFVQHAFVHKRHRVYRRQIAQAVAIEQDFAAGIAAAEIGTALFARFFVDPAGFPRKAHLLQMPVQLLPRRLAAVKNRVVAHLAMGNGLIDFPAAVDLPVQVALGLDAFRIVLVDEANLRSAPHAARNHVFTDDIGDIQQVDGAQLRALATVAQSGGTDDAMDFIQHGQHGFIAAGRAAEHF